ncbi:MAG: NusG domain II-containing protein [Coprococcus eutactus]|jgi:hypothetical protein|nr:NusG domain II-containing protein [Coprococcus eutactus]
MTDMEMKDKYTTKKRDIVLAAVLLILGITGVLIVKYGLKSGNTADVYIDDKLVQTIDMSVDDEYTFQTDKGSNTVEVRNGAVSMKSADCPDKVCVRMGTKNRNGETITCLPHKLVIEVHGGQEQEVDIK